jgi:gamma-glutamylputrescine oxidase
MSAGAARWGSPPWRLVPVSTPPQTAGAKAPDVAIIGGGLTGVSAAYHLARAGIDAVLLEAGWIGYGASGRTGGLVLEGTAAGIRDGADTCIADLSELVAREGIDCDLALPGCWEIRHRESPPERMLPWTDDGHPIGIERTVPGGTVEPAALTRGIAEATARLGAAIRENSRVRAISIAPEAAVELEGERIRPGHVIIATNAWINAMLPGIPRVRSALTFACATRPLDEKTLATLKLDAGIPFYTTDLPYLWGRTIRDGRAIFGSGLVFGAPLDLEEVDSAAGESAAVLARLQARVRALHPALARVEFDCGWAGPIGFTADALPLIGPHPDNPRILMAGAYAGHGVALSVRAGALLAAAIASGTPLPEWASPVRFALRR